MKILVIGGTGSLGSLLIKKLSENNENEITCFSRCELKQKNLEASLGRPGNVHFVLGDVRDYASVNCATRGVDTIFHVAALKHIDVLEANPEECVKTNIQGSINVIRAAKEYGVERVLFSSTDKAVYPVNVYGQSKAISERMFLNAGYTVFRWGNVLASRGSVIPIFIKDLREHNRAYITDKHMTRFWIRLEDAVNFMLKNINYGAGILIPPIKAASVMRVIESCARVLDRPKFEVSVCGIRPGEKLHESLNENLCSDSADRLTDLELDSFVRETIEKGLA